MGRGLLRLTGMALGLLALPLAACSTAASDEAPAQDQQAATHPVSGLEIIDVTVDTGEAKHLFKTEVAATAEEQQRGLMFRTELGPDEGMIFPTEEPRARSFWMKNTPLPLDLIFIGPDRRIANIAAMAEPYSLDPIPSEGAVIAVFEIAGGRAAELGIEPGDAVAW